MGVDMGHASSTCPLLRKASVKAVPSSGIMTAGGLDSTAGRLVAEGLGGERLASHSFNATGGGRDTRVLGWMPRLRHLSCLPRPLAWEAPWCLPRHDCRRILGADSPNAPQVLHHVTGPLTTMWCLLPWESGMLAASFALCAHLCSAGPRHSWGASRLHVSDLTRQMLHHHPVLHGLIWCPPLWGGR